jgi:MtN3 and saliva related transmembrane protein
MDLPNILGMAAGALTTASFVPQVLKTYRSKSAKDVSFWMFAVLGTGVFLWIIFGLFTRSIPVILANSCTFILVLIMVILKIKYAEK